MQVSPHVGKAAHAVMSALSDAQLAELYPIWYKAVESGYQWGVGPKITIVWEKKHALGGTVPLCFSTLAILIHASAWSSEFESNQSKGFEWSHTQAARDALGKWNANPLNETVQPRDQEDFHNALAVKMSDCLGRNKIILKGLLRCRDDLEGLYSSPPDPRSPEFVKWAVKVKDAEDYLEDFYRKHRFKPQLTVDRGSLDGARASLC